MVKPLIGLTPTSELLNQEHGTFRRHALSDNYSMSVESSGGMPVMLPAHIQDVSELLDNLHAVIITGGDDIDPARYGQAPHEKTEQSDPERDAFELAIVHEAIARDMPILGICRGIQVLNVALGGTLVQDLADQRPEGIQHRQQDEKIHHETPTQTATLTAGDHPLRRMVNGDEVEVNSFHHQGIDRLAEPLQVMATTDDGLIEAVYHPELTHVMAVQWHPEMLATTRDDAAVLFRALTDAASAYKLQRSKREATLSV